MFHVFEFERFLVGEKEFVAPFDFGGVVLETGREEPTLTAAAWLKFHLESLVFMESAIPRASRRNTPERGGDILVLGVEVDQDVPNKVRGAEAAKMLGVTPGRITQMWKSGSIVAYKDGSKLWVSEKSLMDRKKLNAKPGRPKANPDIAYRGGRASMPGVLQTKA